MGFAAGDSNLYRYCGGDPVNCRDPFGLEAGKDAEKNYEDEDKDSGTPGSGIPGGGYPVEGSVYADEPDLNGRPDGSDTFTQMLLNGLPRNAAARAPLEDLGQRRPLAQMSAERRLILLAVIGPGPPGPRSAATDYGEV
jgi:hypothetical protein